MTLTRFLRTLSSSASFAAAASSRRDNSSPPPPSSSAHTVYFSIQATIAGPNMKSEINRLQSSGAPCRAFIMGTRRTDPHGAALQVARALPATRKTASVTPLQRFEPSSLSWPAFMRVCPILEWRLADVWSFMSTYSLPYCPLYDRGYASLGSQASTSICPALVSLPPLPPIPFNPVVIF